MGDAPLRAAVVGAGLMGRWHLDALHRAGGVATAIVDPDRERARMLAAGRAYAAASLDELERTSLDVVHVCAPLDAHEKLCLQALALGADVIVEKPIAPDAATAEALLAAAGAAARALVPVHQFSFQPGVRRLLEEVRDWDGLTRCVFEAASAGAERTDLGPDELVADILPHPLALFWRLGLAEDAMTSWQVLRPAPGELRATTVQEGTTFEIVISTRARPIRATLEVAGRRGSGQADLYHGFATVATGSGEGVGKVIRPFAGAGATLGRASANLARRAIRRELSYPGLRELVHRAYDAFRTGDAPPVAPAEVLAVARGRDFILDRVRLLTPDAAG